MTEKRYYKVTGPNGKAVWGGRGSWPLPVGDEPGEWLRVDGDIVACRNGLHVTDAAHLRRWAIDAGNLIFRVEIRGGVVVDHGEKAVVREARLLPGPIAASVVTHPTEPHRASPRDRWLQVYGDTLPVGHPLRAKYDRLMSSTRRAAQTGQKRLAEWLGDDADNYQW